jgi:hypothetical protein
MRRFFVGFLGVMLIFIGIGTLIAPVTYRPMYSTYIDLSNIKWPFFIFTSIFGSVCLYISIYNKGSKTCYWICSKCQETNMLDERTKHQCPQCNIQLEKLDGFYERHPDLR